MPQLSVTPHISERHREWTQALRDHDTKAIGRLAATDEPAAALLALETYINGSYRGLQLSRALATLEVEEKSAAVRPLLDDLRHVLPKLEIAERIAAVMPFVDDIRGRLGWSVREFDLGLLRLIRKSSALSPVLGAGVSMGAGAPSWAELVKLLLKRTLDHGIELRESVPAADNPTQSPFELLPNGGLRLGSGAGTWRYEHRVREVKRYTAEQEALARDVLADVKAKGSATDVEMLMKGAQVCYDLCGQELFRLVTGGIYSRAAAPSKTHRAIAKLAPAQRVPDRGPGLFPGWDSIITYNFDSLMSEALAEEKIPHAAWGMLGGELASDPDELARKSEWHQRVVHLHGYTPRRPFLITHVPFVFSTSQYLTTYRGPRSRVLKAVFDGYLANPVHVALYIGCSFADEAMNQLLHDAFQQFPGRYHYALLKWPYNRVGADPPREGIKVQSAKYLALGVRPVWFDDFSELPDLIARLQ